MNLIDHPVEATVPVPSPEFADEAERMRVVESFEPDALEDDPELAAIVKFAARLCGMPVAQVTLVEEERQRFLAGEGLDVRETPRETSFCQHAMRTPDIMEIKDAAIDPQFEDNALVTGDPHIRYYAGQPLISEEGAPLGALCVIDLQPHGEGLNDFQREGMAVLGQAVMRRLQSRRENIRNRRAIAEREERMRRIIEGVPAIAWSADAEGIFDYFNARWKEFTGEEPPRTAEDWGPYIHPDDAQSVFAEWKRCFSSGSDFECEHRLLQADGSWAWVLSMAVPVSEAEGDPVRWFGTVTDIDEVHTALVQRDLLAKELSHRIKNIFAVVIGLATLKARKSEEHQAFAKELTQVLQSLSRAHEFVRPDSGTVQDSLQGLLAAMFAPYTDGDGELRVRVTGADARIGPGAATPLALVFHELATNSAKYGALSVEDGVVELAVEDGEEMMLLTWREHGGPNVVETGETGFGSRLVEMSVTGNLQGSWDRQFEPDGLVIELTVSKEAIAS